MLRNATINSRGYGFRCKWSVSNVRGHKVRIWGWGLRVLNIMYWGIFIYILIY